MTDTSAGEKLREQLNSALLANTEYDEREIALLDLAASQADDIAALEKLLSEQGGTVTGSMGQARLNPVFAELRQSRLALGKLLAEIRLPDESPGVAKNVARQRAARARWDKARRSA